MKDIQRKEGTRKGKEPASASEFPKKISVTLSFFKPVFFLNSRCVAGEKERNAQKKKISQTNCIFFFPTSSSIMVGMPPVGYCITIDIFHSSSCAVSHHPDRSVFGFRLASATPADGAYLSVCPWPPFLSFKRRTIARASTSSLRPLRVKDGTVFLPFCMPHLLFSSSAAMAF